MTQEWTLPVPKGRHRALRGRSTCPRGRVRPARIDGHELVVYRGAGGAARVVERVASTLLGAHLGHCGEVLGERLRCGFHGMSFDPEGLCVETGYGTRPPPTARLHPWATREAYGQIFAWYDPDGA